MEPASLLQEIDSKTAHRVMRESASPAQHESSSSALQRSALFVRGHYRKLLAISALVLVPCFWHRRIAALVPVLGSVRYLRAVVAASVLPG